MICQPDRIPKMELDQINSLICLAKKQDWASAAKACGQTEVELMTNIRAIETSFQYPIVKPAYPFRGFTPQGERVLKWAREFCFATHETQLHFIKSQRRARIDALLRRRSVSPLRLGLPGPGKGDVELIVEAALHAPDNGGLHPWRLLEFQTDQRNALADCFEAEKRRRDPLASQTDVQHAREHAIRPPVLMAFIVSPKARTRVPNREQWLSAGAALGNMLNAAHQLGFGAIVLSGERCFDPILAKDLGIHSDEFLAGFISLGSVLKPPPNRQYAKTEEVLSQWLVQTPDSQALIR